MDEKIGLNNTSIGHTIDGVLRCEYGSSAPLIPAGRAGVYGLPGIPDGMETVQEYRDDVNGTKRFIILYKMNKDKQKGLQRNFPSSLTPEYIAEAREIERQQGQDGLIAFLRGTPKEKISEALRSQRKTALELVVENH